MASTIPPSTGFVSNPVEDYLTEEERKKLSDELRLELITIMKEQRGDTKPNKYSIPKVRAIRLVRQLSCKDPKQQCSLTQAKLIVEALVL